MPTRRHAPSQSPSRTSRMTTRLQAHEQERQRSHHPAPRNMYETPPQTNQDQPQTPQFSPDDTSFMRTPTNIQPQTFPHPRTPEMNSDLETPLGMLPPRLGTRMPARVEAEEEVREGEGNEREEEEGDEDEDEDEDEDDVETENDAGEDTSTSPDEEDDGEEEEEDEVVSASSPTKQFILPTPKGLRSLLPLAHILLSTSKPTNGVSSLLSPSPLNYWQSDGPQPHIIQLHFFKLVSIVQVSLLLNFELDESYTPTHMSFFAGMSEYDLVHVAEWNGEQPKGWISVNLKGVGGETGGSYVRHATRGGNRGFDWGSTGPDAATLRCMVLQVRILENHQNGKDTHVRGIQVFSREVEADPDLRADMDDEHERYHQQQRRPRLLIDRKSKRKTVPSADEEDQSQVIDEAQMDNDGSAQYQCPHMPKPAPPPVLVPPKESDWMEEPLLR